MQRCRPRDARIDRESANSADKDRSHCIACGAGGRPDMNFTKYGFQVAA